MEEKTKTCETAQEKRDRMSLSVSLNQLKRIRGALTCKYECVRDKYREEKRTLDAIAC